MRQHDSDASDIKKKKKTKQPGNSKSQIPEERNSKLYVTQERIANMSSGS